MYLPSAVSRLRNKYTRYVVLWFIVLLSVPHLLAQKPADDPLPSWNEGKTKSGILAFVADVTNSNNSHFVRPEDRIAVFDNDGTLWAEKPVVEGLFVLSRLKSMAEKNPAMKNTQPYKAALEGDIAYFKDAGLPAILQLLAKTHSGMTEEQFLKEAKNFADSAKYPKLDVPITDIAYKPMVELLEYLRTNGFQTWISSGGSIDFIRVVSPKLYGVPPQQVIGSTFELAWVTNNGRPELLRKPHIAFVNDKTGKPVGISQHIGKRPIFAAGNVRSGGDIAMLEYSGSGSTPSFQLLINHDDAEREFAYSEKDSASLNAARQHGWHVVSMRNDWKQIFSSQQQQAATLHKKCAVAK